MSKLTLVAMSTVAAGGLLVGVIGATASGATANPVSALGAFTARYGAGASVSPAVETSGGNLVAAVATPIQDQGRVASSVVVLQFNGSSWRPVATLGKTDHLDSALGRNTPVLVAHLTTSTATDFFVTFAGADHTEAVVASNVGGHWHLVGFRKGKSLTVTAVNPGISGQYISTSVDNCIPDCASGTSTETSYLYSSSSGAFVAQSF